MGGVKGRGKSPGLEEGECVHFEFGSELTHWKLVVFDGAAIGSALPAYFLSRLIFSLLRVSRELLFLVEVRSLENVVTSVLSSMSFMKATDQVWLVSYSVINLIKG